LTEASGSSSASTNPERPAFTAFQLREDLRRFGSNALLLFVAQLKLGFDDVDAFASNY
jgi:hypothetical protein